MSLFAPPPKDGLFAALFLLVVAVFSLPAAVTAAGLNVVEFELVSTGKEAAGLGSPPTDVPVLQPGRPHSALSGGGQATPESHAASPEEFPDRRCSQRCGPEGRVGVGKHDVRTA